MSPQPLTQTIATAATIKARWTSTGAGWTPTAQQITDALDAAQPQTVDLRHVTR